MLRGSARRFYNTLVSSISRISSIDIAGDIYVIIAGSYNGGSNPDGFINAGRLYSIGRFYSIGIFNYNSSRGG